MRRSNLYWFCCVLLAVFVSLFSVSVFAETVTIRFNYRGGAARTASVEAWIAEFEKLHPNIKVEWELATGNWQEKLIVGMATGTAPDITEFWGNTAQELARSGLLLDLRPYIERDLTDEDIRDIYPPHWENSKVHFGPHKGEQFAMPLYTNTTVIYFNETMFREAGMETPMELELRGEWNWNSLEQLAKKLTRRVGDETTQYGFMTMNTNWFRVVQYIWENGGDWFDRNDPTRFIGDQPEAVEAMEFLHRMTFKDGSMMSTWNYGAFPERRVAMIDDGLNEGFVRYRNAIGDNFEWNMAPRAVGPAGRKPVTMDDGLGIWRQTEHPEEAWEFVKFIASKRGQEIMTTTQGLAPVRRSALPAYLDLDTRLNLEMVMATMHDAEMVITGRTAGEVQRISDAIGYDILVPVLRNNAMSYSVAAAAAKPKIEAILKEGF